MAIEKLKIKGLRGFSEETNVNFAIPDNKNPGSGLTILVGSNNSGKSTIIEAIHLLNNDTEIIPNTSRNVKTNGEVRIEIKDTLGNKTVLQSTENKGAFVQKLYNNQVVDKNNSNNNMNIFILSSKRGFSSTFHNNNYQTRENYKGNINSLDYRSENNINNNFGGRLLSIYTKRDKFDECLEKILCPLPKWTIEALDESNLYLEFSFSGIKHSSKGAGDGYINIFNIVDALYDASEDNVILIDEPEISLHPDLQRKLFSLLVEYSKDKQIIVSTHSPYFVDWKLFADKTKIIRLKKVNDTIKVFELTQQSKEGIKGILKDSFHPHILSLNANEIFFLNDNVILTEGQEDVLCYKAIFEQYEYEPKASFFGWGAGGAPKIKLVLNILVDLGYEKVFTILDNDQRDKVEKLKKLYPRYEFYAIEANDVRNKNRDKNINNIIKKIEKLDMEDKTKRELMEFINTRFQTKRGLVEDMSKYKINAEFNNDIINLLNHIKEYFLNNYPEKYEEIEKNKFIEADDKLIAEQLLNKWLEDNKMFEYTKKRYKNLEFNSGGGGQLSFKKIRKHIYYVIVERTDSMSEKYSLTIDYHIIINTLKNEVKLKKRQIVSNTLPVSKISKVLQKIFR